MSRGYRGVSKLRKTIRRMEPDVQAFVSKAMREVARDVERDAIGIALMKDIRDEGDLIRSIDIQQRPSDPSRVVIGPAATALQWQARPWDNSSIRALKMSAGQKYMKMQFFKGYWHEFGTVNHEARPFMNEAWDQNSTQARAKISKAVGDALRMTARG